MALPILMHWAMPPATLYIWGLGPGSRNLKCSPTPRPNLKFLKRFRVQLTEYYNFGRIELGRHGCFSGLENGHLKPPIIIFPRCAALVKAAPYGARGNLHWPGGRRAPKRRFYLTQNWLKFQVFTVFAPCDAHAGWLADPWPLEMYRVAGAMAQCVSMAPPTRGSGHHPHRTRDRHATVYP